ncbi:MAG: tRNA dihydrouridine synthase DusB [Myxococcota bacterium]
MRIGPYELSSPWILAPMAGVSEMPYRVLVRRMGAGAAPTELVSAKGLLYGQKRTARFLRHDPSEQPFWVQLYGSDACSMADGAEAAKALGAEIIDVNMGCPVRKVSRHGAGSSLLRHPDRAVSIVEAIAERTGLPVTVKIRSGWDANSVNAVEMTKRLVDAGCVGIAVHARTRAQRYSGHANWDLIRRVVEASSVPVIGNGDAFTPDAALRMKSETGCDAVMIGRGALGNPWIFQQLASGDDTPPTPADRAAVVADHFRAHLEFVGDELVAVRKFRQPLIWYARGLRNAATFRCNVTKIDTAADVADACEAFFSDATGEGDPAKAGDFDTRTALG